MQVGYARVSTVEQNLRMQVDALREAGCDPILQDHGVSGDADEKPALREALGMLGEGDVLVVWRLDRLSRSLGELIETVTGFDRAGIGFRSLREAVDTTSAGGRLVFHIMGALAEFERDVIRERTRAGMQAARNAGKRVGRPPTITDERWAHARPLLTGEVPKTVAEIATLLGVSRQAVYKRLKMEAGGR